MARPIPTGYEIGKKLADAGLIPRATRRIVVDISMNDLVTVYYSTYPDSAFLDKLIEHLTDAKFVEVPEKPAVPQYDRCRETQKVGRFKK